MTAAALRHARYVVTENPITLIAFLMLLGLLLLALVIVVVYTGRAAFTSPLAIVVLAAIGLAALLLQLRLRKDLSTAVRAPFWLNAAGLASDM